MPRLHRANLASCIPVNKLWYLVTTRRVSSPYISPPGRTFYADTDLHCGHMYHEVFASIRTSRVTRLPRFLEPAPTSENNSYCPMDFAVLWVKVKSGLTTRFMNEPYCHTQESAVCCLISCGEAIKTVTPKSAQSSDCSEVAYSILHLRATRTSRELMRTLSSRPKRISSHFRLD